MKKRITRKPSYILFYKPYGVLSQFTREAGRKSLASFGPFPGDVYPVGRLDADSEGLLLLTNDNEVKHRLTDPGFGHPRVYLVQVENIPTEESLEHLRKGVTMEGTQTKRAIVSLLEGEPMLPPRPVPIRVRKNIPTRWIRMILSEGKNRQVRRMTAAVGHPTLRLVRVAIGGLEIDGLSPGEYRHLTAKEANDLRNELNSPGKQTA